MQHPQLSSIYFSTSIFTPLLAFFLQIDTLTHTDTHTHIHAYRELVSVSWLSLLLLLLLRLSGCQAAAASSMLLACRKRENLQRSTQREKFTNGKLRVHTCSIHIHTYIHLYTRTPTLAALTPNPHSVPARSFVCHFRLFYSISSQAKFAKNSLKIQRAKCHAICHTCSCTCHAPPLPLHAQACLIGCHINVLEICHFLLAKVERKKLFI